MKVTIACDHCWCITTSIDMPLRDNIPDNCKETGYTNVYCTSCGKGYIVKVTVIDMGIEPWLSR